MMRALLNIGIFCLLLIVGQAAYAQNVKVAGNAGPEDIGAAYNFLPIAKTFGMDNVAFANVNEGRTQMLVEYLPDGQTVENWTRMFTVLIVPTAEDDTGNIATAQLIDNMQKSLQGSDRKMVKAFEKVDLGVRGPGAFMHYVIQGEENAGVIMRDTKTFLVVMQIQARNGNKLTEQDLAKAKALLTRAP